MRKEKNILLLTIALLIMLFSIFLLSAGSPVGPTTVVSVANETKTSVNNAAFFNTSGGYISSLNISTNSQNGRWKAFVGWVNGKFTLDDQGGATIYDWALTLTTGRVYATRASGTPTWSSIACANVATSLATENTAMVHNVTAADNINQTFKAGTHRSFWVAGHSFSANQCPTLNTYVNNVSQDAAFEEMALYDNTNIIYTTILENRLGGYDGQAYDFQMLVPENGTQGFTGATPYYLYVELD